MESPASASCCLGEASQQTWARLRKAPEGPLGKEGTKGQRGSKAATGSVRQDRPRDGQALVPRRFKCPGQGHASIIKGLSFRPDATSSWPDPVRHTLICMEDL